jgi:hypothetical protein
MIAASAFRLPLSPARCFARLHRLGPVRVAGVSYQCRHDDVLAYFATRRDGAFALLRR